VSSRSLTFPTRSMILPPLTPKNHRWEVPKRRFLTPITCQKNMVSNFLISRCLCESNYPFFWLPIFTLRIRGSPHSLIITTKPYFHNHVIWKWTDSPSFIFPTVMYQTDLFRDGDQMRCTRYHLRLQLDV